MTQGFGTLYHPKSALVFYETEAADSEGYIEYFDMDSNGCPVNAHPLTVQEAQALAKSLDTRTETGKKFLQPEGILPPNVLQVHASGNGSVLWFTKAQERALFFSEGLGIPNGNACVPPMVWCASKTTLRVFALKGSRRPQQHTPLYHAPFFNVYEDGSVCMGTVDVQVKQSASLDTFMKAWERYFFHSYFSHLMAGHNPVRGNCVQLWLEQLQSGNAFPKEALKKTKRTIKNLL